MGDTAGFFDDYISSDDAIGYTPGVSDIRELMRYLKKNGVGVIPIAGKKRNEAFLVPKDELKAAIKSDLEVVVGRAPRKQQSKEFLAWEKERGKLLNPKKQLKQAKRMGAPAKEIEIIQKEIASLERKANAAKKVWEKVKEFEANK